MDDARTGRRSPGATGRSDDGDLVRDFEVAAERRTRENRLVAGRRADSRRRTRLWTRLLLLAAVIGLATILPRYLGERPGDLLESVPDELIGTWATDEPAYVGRTMTVGQRELRLGLGPEGESVHRVHSIRVAVGPVHREYEITYATPAGEQVLNVFVYDDGLLRLRNPSEVRWSRTSGADTPS